MPTNQEFECSDSPEEDALLRITGKYQKHPSIKLIKSKTKSQAFKFRDTNINEIKKIYRKSWSQKSRKSDMNKKKFSFCNIHVMISMLLYILQSFIMN